MSCLSQVPGSATAGDQTGDSSDGVWCCHGAYLHVYGPSSHCIQPFWWSTGKEPSHVTRKMIETDQCRDQG